MPQLQQSVASEPPPQHTILLVDDHPLFRCGLRALLPEALYVVIEASTAEEATACAVERSIDLAIVELLRGDDGVALTARLRTMSPRCKVMGLSAREDSSRISDMLRAGASGYAFKQQEAVELVGAIEAVLRGERYLPASLGRESIDEIDALGRHSSLDDLSKREREVFDHLIRGGSNDAIATALFVSLRTVETHRQNVLRKVGAHTIVELVHFAARAGLLRD